jgi:hypothetical protein
MMRMPSVALIEIIIIAIVVGLPLLVGGVVLAIVVRRQRARRTQTDPQPGSGSTTSRSSNLGKWLLLLGAALAVLLAVPLAVVAGSFLLVIPVRSARTTQQGPAPVVQVVAMPTSAETPMVATPMHTPRPTSESGTGLVEAPPPEPTSLSITPDDNSMFVTLPGIAGLAVLVGVVILGIVLKRWQRSDPRMKTVGETRGGIGSRSAVALVALATLAVLSIFVILALDFSIWTLVWSIVIFALCSILVGLLLLVPWLLRRGQGRDSQLWDHGIVDDAGDDWTQTARLRYALLAIAIWFALSIYLILDVAFAVSVYWQVAAIYAAFWILIGALLLVGSPSREKLLILGLLVVALFSIRFVDWNSRKPFLKDLHRVQEGMTIDEVEQIMGDYMGGICYPDHPLGLPARESVAEAEELALPDRAVYRHTNEGWGDSDWGEIHFEKGRVKEVRFLPD